MSLRLHFFGAAQMVTGSCYLVETPEGRLLVDCGMFQGRRETRERNYTDFSFDPSSIDCLVLTHGHIDHVGLVPKLVNHGFLGPICATPATCELTAILLADSAHIQEMEVERKNRKLSRAGKPSISPIYTVGDAQRASRLLKPIDYGEEAEAFPGAKFVLRDAGHILGSASVHLVVSAPGADETGLLFSGDLGRPGQPIVNDPSPPPSCEYIVMESTYGDEVRPERPDETSGGRALAGIIRDTFRRGGNVIIPAFAVERTQDLLYALNWLITRGEIERSDIYLDSPLAIDVTEVFCRNHTDFDEKARQAWGQEERCPLLLPGLNLTRSTEESIAINKIKAGAIIIAGSGMCEAGRIKHHLKHNLWRPECSVVFVGYQAQGTKGRQILDGKPIVRIHGEDVRVRAQIHSIPSFSAHADGEELVSWLKSAEAPPKGVFLTHGEPEAIRVLSGRLENELGLKAEVPALAAGYSLAPEFGVLEQGRERIKTAETLESTLWRVYGGLGDKITGLVRKRDAARDLGTVLRRLEEVDSSLEKALHSSK
ncbi:MAG: MBL fold metallo-hydrolase [Firmicutes bacterium]|nr:MBL fold metallo-hydrolase [Bacillota bacterium]